MMRRPRKKRFTVYASAGSLAWLSDMARNMRVTRSSLIMYAFNEWMRPRPVMACWRHGNENTQAWQFAPFKEG